MNSYNLIPVAVKQIIDAVSDKTIPENIRWNYYQTLTYIKEASEEAIKKYNK